MARPPLPLRPSEPVQVQMEDGRWRWSENFFAIMRLIESVVSNLIDLETDVEGELPIENGGTSGGTAIVAFGNLSPLTTEGDLLTHDGSNNIRLGIGAANTVLTSDGTVISWQPASSVSDDHVVMSDGANPAMPVNDGNGNFIYVPYTP